MKKKLLGKSCHKVRYKTEADARRAFKEYGKERGAKRFYKCPHHKSETWHLTSEPR